jgi:glutathione S-transferase
LSEAKPGGRAIDTRISPALDTRYTRGRMITLYSYPSLFGVADNNGYGLKVFAFLKLASVPFVHEHIFDASAAPRGQLPYIVDDGEMIGDSETIIAHLIGKYALTIDAALGAYQRGLNLLITRMLDDLYWVMSYSRWKDERYWPLFRDALMREHPSLTAEGLLKARAFNFQRYHFQGIGRYAPDAAYARGLADLKVLADLIPAGMYVHGAAPTSIDAGIYGFIANIWFYDIDTPLKQCVASQPNLVSHCTAIHDAVMRR